MGRTIPTTRPKIEGPRLAAESPAMRRRGCRAGLRGLRLSARHRNAGAESAAAAYRRAGASHGASASVHLRARLLVPSFNTSTVMRVGRVPGPLPLRGFDARRPGTPALRLRRDVSLSPCECGVREDRRWLGKFDDAAAAPDDRPATPRRTRRPAAPLDSELSWPTSTAPNRHRSTPPQIRLESPRMVHTYAMSSPCTRYLSMPVQCGFPGSSVCTFLADLLCRVSVGLSQSVLRRRGASTMCGAMEQRIEALRRLQANFNHARTAYIRRRILRRSFLATWLPACRAQRSAAASQLRQARAT